MLPSVGANMVMSESDIIISRIPEFPIMPDSVLKPSFCRPGSKLSESDSAGTVS